MRLILIWILFLAMGCSGNAQTDPVSADEFEKGMMSKDAQLLDVRTAGEFRSGHIKGAMQANWNNEQEFTERIQSLDKNKTVYIYCLGGPRSQHAAEWMRENGFKNVVELAGGLNNWRRSGKPVEGASTIPQMTMAEYQQQIKDKPFVLVDFGAEWCPPCRKMEPVVNELLAKNPGIFFLKIDGGVHFDLMKELNVEGLPTFIILKNGQEIWRRKGEIPAAEFDAVLKEKK